MNLHKILTVIMLIGCVLTGRAVQMTSYEYWIDDGYSSKQTANATAEEITRTIDVADLKSGVHFLNVRLFNSDSQVSSPIRYLFYIPESNGPAGKLSGCEYWLDDDYASRQSVSECGEEQSYSVDVSALASGVHFLNYRTFADNGAVGNLTRYLFYIPESNGPAGKLSGCEYWLDDDYASRQTVSECGEEQTYSVDVSALSSGVHFLNYRTFADNGSVGNLTRYLFYLPDSTGATGSISSCEYWLDDAYDARVSMPCSGESQSFIVDVSGVAPGVHFLNHRSFTDIGTVGVLSRMLFYVGDNNAAPGSPIVGYEYSFNDKTTYVPVTPCEEYKMENFAIPMPDILETATIDENCKFAFADGKATMTNDAKVCFLLRFKNAGGESSMPLCLDYDDSYTVTRDAAELKLQKSVLLDKVTSGDFRAMTFDIDTYGVYYLRSTQACDMYIFDSNANLKAVIKSDQLLKTYALSVTAGKYYGIIFNTPTNEANSEKQIGIRLMATDNSVPTPEIVYENETITITCLQEDASIYYTIDGSMPDETKTLYTKPFELKHNAEIKAIGKAPDLADSFIATLKVDSYKVENPEIVFANLKVYITCSTPDARIYYTLDGSDPSRNGRLYTEPLPVSSSCTVMAVAKRDNYNDSETVRYALDISTVKCSTPTLTINGNLLTMSTLTEGASIHYTTDGSVPNAGSAVYTAPILLDHNCVYKAVAMKGGEIDSDVAEITVDWFQAETPQFSYADGVLTITCKTHGSSIYYEIGGAEPSIKSNLYTKPVTLTDNRIVKAFAVAPGFNDSEIVSFSPTSFTCGAPEIRFDGRAIELSSSTPGAAIYFTIDGSNPGTDSELYGSRKVLPGLCTVKAIAVKSEMNNSAVTTYTLPSYYNGENVYVKEPGSMSKAFEWCGGSVGEESMTVEGTLNDTDFATIRSQRLLSHLDLSKVSVVSVPDEAFKNMGLVSLTMPECGFKAGSKLLSGCKDFAALTWNSGTEIPLDILDGLNLPNMLLYVKYTAVANAKFGNIIVGNMAESIVLSDADHSNFYCPAAFTARKISYTHNYSQRSGFERCSGWESIALPFSPQRITHEKNGEMSPFAAGDTGKKQFWLCELTPSGFASAASIEANTPYIIAMPNCDRYSDDYILAGNVTFSGNNLTVEASDNLVTSSKGGNIFIPNFVSRDKDKCMTLNVGEPYNGHPEGSLFVHGLRDARPFEAYVTNSSAARTFAISFDSSDIYILPDNEDVKVETFGHVMNVMNLMAGDVVDVMTADGIHVFHGSASRSGSLQLEDVPAGTVVVIVTRAGSQIYRTKHILKNH